MDFLSYDSENGEKYDLEQELMPDSKRARDASAAPTSVNLPAVPAV